MASDFNFNLNDLSDAKSITSKIKSSFYPENQQIIKNTSASVEGEVGRSLMSRDPAKIIQGDGVFRNPAFALAGYEQNTKSAMHTIISMGADIDDQTSVADPDDPTKTLKGSQARMEIARKSIMSTGFAPGGFERSMNAFVASKVSSATAGGGTTAGAGGGSGSSTGTGTVTTSTGATQPHSTASYGTSGSAPVLNFSTRKIAFADEMDATERQIYDQKVAELLKKANFKPEGGNDIYVFKNGFKLSFNELGKVNGVLSSSAKKNPQNISNLGFDIYQSGYYVEQNGRYRFKKDKVDGLGTGEKQVLMAPTVVEFLLRITDTLYIMGDTGVWRGIIGPNFSKLTSTNTSVSDHSFGRGFDIKKIGLTTANQSFTLNNPVPPPGTYLVALDIFLSHVEQLPQELHPDLIVVSADLETELGIVDGLESSNSAIRLKHPNLAPFTNIHCDNSHRNHIHVSWSSSRCGAFSVPATTAPATSGSSGSGNVTAASAAPPISADMLTKLKTEYYTGLQDKDALTPSDIFKFLYNYGGFSAEIAAIFAGIAVRESNCIPFVSNTGGAFGLWQFGTRVKDGGAGIVKIVSPTEERIKFWQLTYKDWKKEKLIDNNKTSPKYCDTFIRNKQRTDPEGVNGLRKKKGGAGRQYYDRRAFAPINQISFLRTKIGKKIDVSDIVDSMDNGTKNGIFAPWGSVYLEHSWISGLNYDIIKQVFTEGTGRDSSELDAWILASVPANSDARKIDHTDANGRQKIEVFVKDSKIYEIIYK